MVVFTHRGASLIESLVSPDGTLDRSAVMRVDVSTDLRVHDMEWLAVLFSLPIIRILVVVVENNGSIFRSYNYWTANLGAMSLSDTCPMDC